jgi:hypothetical protein
MKLLEYLHDRTERWSEVFAQDRSLQRAKTLGFGLLCGVGRRTLTRSIGFHGKTNQDWSADYKVFSRSEWDSRELFDPILEEAIDHHDLKRIVASMDDTKVWRTGQKVPQTQWHRDPLGPAFATNLRWGHRFLSASLVLPLYEHNPEASSRCVPIRFEMAPVVKKPGSKATPEEMTQYRALKCGQNLSRQFNQMADELREQLNRTGHADKQLVIVGDGSFCNRTVFGEQWNQKNIALVTRCRKDLALCYPAKDGRRFYDPQKFTPEQVRTDDARAPWQKASVFHGGCYRDVRYKELPQIHWQRGARKRPVRLLVVAPVGYRTTKKGRIYYRQPAYLLTSDLKTPAAILLQDYFDRWGIEINHRDQKEVLGLGQAQVWNQNSVSKVPALLVAMYSWLLLGGIHCYGTGRTADYLPLPKWRKRAKQPSCMDLVALLRTQIAQAITPFPTAAAPPSMASMVQSAAA